MLVYWRVLWLPDCLQHQPRQAAADALNAPVPQHEMVNVGEAAGIDGDIHPCYITLGK